MLSPSDNVLLPQRNATSRRWRRGGAAGHQFERHAEDRVHGAGVEIDQFGFGIVPIANPAKSTSCPQAYHQNPPLSPNRLRETEAR